jgi:hypothetical protein
MSDIISSESISEYSDNFTGGAGETYMIGVALLFCCTVSITCCSLCCVISNGTYCDNSGKKK